MSRSETDDQSVAACALVTRSYIPFAKVLARSFLASHPDGRLYVLLIDDKAPTVIEDPRVTVLGPEDLQYPYYYELAVRYDTLQLSCALKPILARAVLQRYEEPSVFYLDGDLWILHPIDEAATLLREHDLLLTPHTLSPIEPDDRQPDELYILSGGVYNMGFFGVRATPEGRRFLDWWADRLRTGCLIDLRRGMYLDQRWIDLVPGLFPGTAILRDDTYNVAYWNLDARHLEKQEDRYLVNGRPLTVIHFCGVDFAARQFKESYQSRLQITSGTALHALVSEYAALLESHGMGASQPPCAFASFDNGVPFHSLFRTLFLGLPEQRRLEFGNPFTTNSPDSFFDWAVTPDPERALLSPFLGAIYESNPEIPRRFPDVGGTHRGAFIRWARTQAAEILGFDPALVRSNPEDNFGPQSPPVEVQAPDSDGDRSELRARLAAAEDELGRIYRSRWWRGTTD